MQYGCLGNVSLYYLGKLRVSGINNYLKVIAAVTYSTKQFEKSRKLNVKSASCLGKADHIFEFTQDDIDENFKEKNKKILSYSRGAGLWLWKPYVINKALSLIKEGDYLIYSEAASVFIKPVKLLVDALEASGQDLMVYDLPLVSEQWTKRETFISLKCENKGFEAKNQISASFILLKKSPFSVKLIAEYLNNCCDEVAISSIQFNPDIKNSDIFLAHREDQSIFSLLCMKYSLKTFRDPSQFGLRPWEYILSGKVIYKPVKYENSSYPAIFLHTRKKINLVSLLKELIKRGLTHFSVYGKIEISRRMKISKKI
jgi:hypothetical protein